MLELLKIVLIKQRVERDLYENLEEEKLLKKHVIGVLAVVLLILVSFTGCIQTQAIGVYPGAVEIDVETEFISQFLDIPEDEIDTAVSDLNIKTYGINGISKNIILAWYANRHLDWSLKKSSDANLYSMRAWISLLDGHVVAVSDLRSLQDLVGYDVVFLTSSAPLTTYSEYISYL